MAGDGQTIIDLDKKRMLAMAAKDFAMLNEVLADDLVYTHSSARLDTKQSLIAKICERILLHSISLRMARPLSALGKPP
jgi:hypothetical protein